MAVVVGVALLLGGAGVVLPSGSKKSSTAESAITLCARYEKRGSDLTSGAVRSAAARTKRPDSSWISAGNDADESFTHKLEEGPGTAPPLSATRTPGTNECATCYAHGPVLMELCTRPYVLGVLTAVHGGTRADRGPGVVGAGG